MNWGDLATTCKRELERPFTSERSELVLWTSALVLWAWSVLGQTSGAWAHADDPLNAHMLEIFQLGWGGINSNPSDHFQYRFAFWAPLAWLNRVTTWTPHALVLWIQIMGAWGVGALYLWVRSYGRALQSTAALAALILACYPSWVGDSQLVTNDIQVVSLCLSAAASLGWARVWWGQGAHARSRAVACGLATLAGGLAFLAYMTKIASIPMLGVLGLVELSTPRNLPKRSGSWCLFAIFAGVLMVGQAVLDWKSGRVLGNLRAEIQFMHAHVPRDRLAPEALRGYLMMYPRMLFWLKPSPWMETPIHSIWMWIWAIGLAGGLWLFARTGERRTHPLLVRCALATLLLGLFLEFWPSHWSPYVPQWFQYRFVSRYLSPLIPFACVFAAGWLLVLRRSRWIVVSGIATLLLVAGFAVAGFGSGQTSWENRDRSQDLQIMLTTAQSPPVACKQLPLLMDWAALYGIDSAVRGRDRLSWLEPTVEVGARGPLTQVFPVRGKRFRNDLDRFCVLTGGARRYDFPAVSPPTHEYSSEGLRLSLLAEWPGPKTAWRNDNLRLWLAERPKPIPRDRP